MAITTLLGTKSPGEVGTSAPNFTIHVGGGEVPLGVRQLIQRVEYESADGYADALKVLAWDPDFVPPKGTPGIGGLGGRGAAGGGSGRLVDTKIFQPGNELTIGFGYGAQILHVGRAVIRKQRPTYPSNDVPTIEVVAYTADVKMMDNAPEGSKKKKGKGGRRYKDSTWAEAVRDRAADYGFHPDVDDTGDQPHDFIQKVGLSDYDFVNGLANLTGFVFWVDGDENGRWTLHFKNPEKLSASDVQDRKYTFKYNDGDFSSLLAFEPEIAIQGSTTKLRAQVKDPQTGRVIEVEFTEENDDAPEVRVEVRGDNLRAADQALQGEHTTASDVKLFIDDFAFEERSNRQFRSEAELEAWARQWFRRQRENFIMSRGVTIGTERLMARQTHRIQGVGPTLSGDYYFSRVKHILDNENGYLCDFNCRKVVPPLP